MARDYTRLHELLQNETYPYTHIFKFVGRNTPAFEAGIRELEAAFAQLRIQTSRLSAANAQGIQAHRSQSYEMEVAAAHEVIAVLRKIETIEDLLIVL